MNHFHHFPHGAGLVLVLIVLAIAVMAILNRDARSVAACLIVVVLLVMLTGCAAMPDKLIVGVDHTSHLLQHFEHESDYGMIGCTGPMVGVRWDRNQWFAQATEKYCVNGLTDGQSEVTSVQAGLLVNLK